MTTRPPPLVYHRAPCPRCGACNEAEAETRCRPDRDVTGEGTCPAERTDAAGWFLFPTPESLARLDAYYAALSAQENG